MKTLPGGGNPTDDVVQTSAARSRASESCHFEQADEPKIGPAFVDPPPFRVRVIQRQLNIALTALKHYRAVDDELVRFTAGFVATAEMHDPKSIAGQALDLIEAIG